MNTNAFQTSSGRGNRVGLIQPKTIVLRYHSISMTSTVMTPTLFRLLFFCLTVATLTPCGVQCKRFQLLFMPILICQLI